MQNYRRRGWSISRFIISAFVLYLAISALYYGAISLIQHFGGGATGTATTAVTTTTGVTTVTSNGTVTVVTTTATITATDNMSLAQLQSLSFNSTKCSGFLSPSWWDTAIGASGETVTTIIPNTAYGLRESYGGWASYFRDNASYVGLYNYTFSFMMSFAAKVMGTHDMTKAVAVVKNYTAYVAAVPVTAADYISFGGLSALRVVTDTGNLTQAMAQTFPAQVYQLFAMSQDCSYTEQQRAKLFGTAMSMSLFVLAVSGKDGFGPKWRALLEQLGLRDAWTGMKGYLKQIMDTSPEAAYHTTMVLSTLVKKFPNANVVDLAAFTSSRIANMVTVLKEKGYSAEEIAQKVADLDHVVDESDDQGHVADVADAISYQVEGFMRVTVNSRLVPVLVSETTPHSISASFLASVVPDFKVGERTALKVTIHKSWMELQSYEVYEGGKSVAFSLPNEEVQPGDMVGLSFEVLSVEDFARSIPDVVLNGRPGVSWVADSVLLKDFRVVDGVLQFRVLQINHWSSMTEFTINGKIVKYPGVSHNEGGIYAEFAIKDYAGRTRDLRLRFDGFSFNGAGLTLVEGDKSRSVLLVSFDDFRLKIVTPYEVGTIYIEPPSETVYSVAEMYPYAGSYLNQVQGMYTNAWHIDSVVMLRDLEKQMTDGSPYDKGRVGAEIAYVVCDRNLGLKDVILEDPSVGGRDLYTKDNRVAIQARLLTDFSKGDRETIIQKNLFDLVDKLQKDYQYQQPQMQDGYAILSYLDTDGTVKTIILEVPKL